MKLFTSTLLLFVSLFSFSQQSEDLIPTSAISVFSIHSEKLLETISMDDLVSYDFMEDVHQELFDGSTSGKTLKESGIDFTKKFNVFFGKGTRYEISGFTFNIANEDQLFEVFDDFEQKKSNYTGTEWYNSYFNHLIVSGKTALMIRVSSDYDLIQTVTDSTWKARGNDFSFYNTWDGAADKVEFTEEMEIEENTSTPVKDIQLPVAEDDPTTKTYFELRDSIEFVYDAEFLKEVLDDLFIAKNNLKKTTPLFAQQLTHDSEGVFYFDNARYNRKGNYSYYRPFYSSIYNSVNELYEENTIVGDIIIRDGEIDLKVDANYNEQLGAIYSDLSKAKFDKNVLKYIHTDNQSFFTYNINIKKAYEKAYEIIVPILESSDDGRATKSLIGLEFFDEFANKDALFDTYRGSMFGTFNGIKKVKTKQVIYTYDDNFEYHKEIIEGEEDMPIFTFGFSSKNNEFSEKFMKRIERLSHKEVYAKNGVWVIERGALDAADLFVVLKNDLVIFTNDEDLAMNHSDGYGKESLDKTLSKKAKKSKFLFGYANLGSIAQGLPSEIFNSRENKIIDVLKNKSGRVELTSTEINDKKSSFKLAYTFDGENEDISKYVLDLINSLYVNSK
ncbi:MAG TPA: hypothetical protein EYG86_05475 [Crocinitomicaceae bacterium]|nr:hypothetical protein [Crocinitomicaceae bacterium]